MTVPGADWKKHRADEPSAARATNGLRGFCAAISLLLMAAASSAQDNLPRRAPFSRIAFGSCAHQDKPQPIWDAIQEKRPELILLLGDNVYADSTHPLQIRAAYRKLNEQPGFQKLRTSCRLLGTWDDHDYGINDGGSEHPHKVGSQAALLDFLRVPAASPRRKRRGVYHAEVFGPAGRRVQVVLLDTRYHRSQLAGITFAGRTIYVADDNPEKSMLGEQQWQWLARQLERPAELRLIVSSIQVLPADHPFEKWNNFPHERSRLLTLLKREANSPVLLLSGDQHLGELTRARFAEHDFLEATSSGLTHHRGTLPAPNSHRVGDPLVAENFGLLEVDWRDPDPLATITICDVGGEARIQEQVRFSELTP